MTEAKQTVSISQALNTAVRHFQSGQWPEAENICRQILSIEPRHPDTLHLLGVIAIQTGHYREAIKLLRQAIKIKDDVPFYYSNLGLAFQNDGKLAEAMTQYRRALTLKPDLAEARMNIGNILKTEGKLDEAIAQFQQALAFKPDLAEAHYNLGLLFQTQGKPGAAAAQYRQAITLNPRLAEAHVNLGALLKEEGRLDDAVAEHQQAIALKPQLAEAYNNLGIALHTQGKADAAVAQYQQAIALDPDNAEAHYNLGMTLVSQGKIEEAIAHYERAHALRPDNTGVLSHLVHQLHHACAWDRVAEPEQQLLDMARRGQGGISPFIILNTAATPSDQLACASAFVRQYEVPAEDMFRHTPGKETGKIRLGYLSGDFHQHAVACLIAELIERHDRARFEVTAYSYGPADDSDMRRRLVKAFDRFVDLRATPHAEAAQKIYDDGTDILIDLKSLTGESRMQIPAFRPAPVQINYLGYPGTTGARFMDYIIADPFILPMDQQAFYSEKVIQLPDCYQPNDTTRKIAADTPDRAALGLPEQGIVFCCFNQSFKITPAVFDVWMRLLQNMPGSVLWLLQSNALMRDNLRREAERRGVAPDRLVFAHRTPLPEHLARHRLADLFLDTLPVNAHTTASDALWAGLPVLTCCGESFAGRVAGSLLTAAGLPDLITYSLQEYETLALQLARTPERLLEYRLKLDRTQQQAPLFDIAQFTANIENAYQALWKNWQDGHAAKSFSVPPQKK